MEDEELENIAKECEATEINLSIILYAYLGAKKAGMGGLYAEHCQDFARSGLNIIKQNQLRRN